MSERMDAGQRRDDAADNKLIGMIVIIVLALVVVQSINNIRQAYDLAEDTEGTATVEQAMDIVSVDKVMDMPRTQGEGALEYSDIGIATLCINNPPQITYDCNLTNATLNRSLRYECQFNATDLNGNGVAFETVWLTTPEIFNVTSDGRINFTPTRIATGRSNIVRLDALDDSGCTNNRDSRLLNITVVGENRPPYLAHELPAQTITKDHYIIFYLSDYFTDPDDDPLDYFSILQNGNTIRVTISGNRVEIRGIGCGVSTAYFVATDPFGLTAKSNNIQYTVDCSNTSSQVSSSSDDQEGGGGGGGGGVIETCYSNWKCTSWSPCQLNNFTYRRCIDYNGCDITNYDHYMFDNCTYVPGPRCTENWDCTEWSTCDNKIHTRMCMDLSACGTNFSKPLETDNCSGIPSCFNGIQDQGETGIDCGGPCGICRNVETPGKTKIVGLATLIAGAITVSTAAIFAVIFRKRLVEAYSRIFGKKPRSKRKLYISNKQKDKLLQELNIVQSRLDEHKIDHAIDELNIFMKEYFKQLLAIDTVDRQELVSRIVKLKNKELERILVMFYAKVVNMVHMRNRGVAFNEIEIQSLVDEASHNIYLIAEFGEQDALNAVKYRSITGNDKDSQDKAAAAAMRKRGMKAGDKIGDKVLDRSDIIYNQLSNLYIALKFTELIAAKNIYTQILKEYEPLTNVEKGMRYNDIIRAFHAISYLEEEFK